MTLTMLRVWKTHSPGDVIDVEDEKIAAWLVKTGAAIQFEEPVHKDDEQAQEAEEENVNENSDDTEYEEVEEVEEETLPETPLKTAKINVWREYAKSIGIDTAGMKKLEIIAACEKLSNN